MAEILSFKEMVRYIRIKSEGPFKLRQCRQGYWSIWGRNEKFVWWAALNGNSKQRRQQRRKLLRELNA